MSELEGSMHIHADNPEPEPVFVVCCSSCGEDLFVGDKAVRPTDGIVCPDCWHDWQVEQTTQKTFNLDRDTVA